MADDTCDAVIRSILNRHPTVHFEPIGCDTVHKKSGKRFATILFFDEGVKFSRIRAIKQDLIETPLTLMENGVVAAKSINVKIAYIVPKACDTSTVKCEKLSELADMNLGAEVTSDQLDKLVEEHSVVVNGGDDSENAADTATVTQPTTSDKKKKRKGKKIESENFRWKNW